MRSLRDRASAFLRLARATQRERARALMQRIRRVLLLPGDSSLRGTEAFGDAVEKFDKTARRRECLHERRERRRVSDTEFRVHELCANGGAATTCCIRPAPRAIVTTLTILVEARCFHLRHGGVCRTRDNEHFRHLVSVACAPSCAMLIPLRRRRRRRRRQSHFHHQRE
jgi:hypothetical protein